MKRNPNFFPYNPKKIPSPQRGDPLVQENQEEPSRFQSAKKAYVSPLGRSNSKATKST